jgi:serine/threonine protein kinase
MASAATVAASATPLTAGAQGVHHNSPAGAASSGAALPATSTAATPAAAGGASPTAPPTSAPITTLQHNTLTYQAERVIGHGSFGVVYLARIVETGEYVAVKKVLQDRRFQSRELALLRRVRHPNVNALRHCFYTSGDRPDELYLNLVLDFVPDTLLRFAKMFSQQREFVPLTYVRVFMFQLCRALAFLHRSKLNVCHRDCKPGNMLLDPTTGVLQLCDFGSAKVLSSSDSSMSYICSRYYRAPELIFGATSYTTAIDNWAVGCVVAELLLGQPLFVGDGSVGQMVEIVKVLGTPTADDFRAMNRAYADFSFPNVRPLPWSRVFRSHTPSDAVDLVASLLKYDPSRRMLMVDALAHPFFDELRDPATTLPNGAALPPLFDFSEEERASMTAAQLQRTLPVQRA